MTKRITLATVKSFIRKNASELYIREDSRFDGMHDMVMSNKDAQFRQVDQTTIDFDNKSTLGIHGAWFVRGSRDSFAEYDDGAYFGIHIWNCCGSWVIAVKR